MDDFYSREITLADMPFLMHEFELGTLTQSLSVLFNEPTLQIPAS